MSEIKLHVSTAAFNNPLHSEKAYRYAGGSAKLISQFTQRETLGFGIFLYQRTILSPAGTALEEDHLLLTLTPAGAVHTNNSLRRSYLSSPGLPTDLVHSVFTEPGTNPNLPPPVIDRQGQIHLLQLAKSRGQGYLWYTLNYRRSKAA